MKDDEYGPGSLEGVQARAATVGAALFEAANILRRAGDVNPRLTSELLLGHILGWSRVRVLSSLAEAVPPATSRRFFAVIARRAAGEPLAYIIQKQEFYGLAFVVSPGVLIPRPETEQLVEQAARLAARGHRETVWFVDVGTGSGCIAVALARQLESSRGWATDISRTALDVARRNAAFHDVGKRVEFVRANLLECFRPGPRFDMVLANLPYLPSRDSGIIEPSVRDYEPHEALFAGPTGMECYAQLVPQARCVLCSGGHLLLEMDPAQADPLRRLLEGSGFAIEAILNDLRGWARCIVARRRDG